MFLSGSFLGIASFQQTIPISVKRAYTKIKVYGNATIDKLQVRSTEIDNTTLQNMIITDTGKWTPDTLLLAEFENTLAGGNITGLTGTVKNWQITRTDSSTSVLKTLGTVDVSQVSYTDYSAQANKTYTYDVFAMSDTQLSEPLQTSQVDTSSVFGYFLVDQNQNVVYKFDLEVTSGENKYEEDVTVYDTYTTYPAVAIGKKKYLTTTIQALCGTISTTDGSLQQPISYIETLRDFVLNGQQKLFKTRKGGIYNCITRNFRFKTLNDGVGSQPMLVSFDVIEVASV